MSRSMRNGDGNSRQRKTISAEAKNTYSWRCNKGTVKVRVRTGAQGQSRIAGIFDVVTRLWRNEKSTAPIPAPIKALIEQQYVA